METNDNNSTKPQLLWDAAKAVLRGKAYSNTGLSQERRTITNEQSKITLMKL